MTAFAPHRPLDREPDELDEHPGDDPPSRDDDDGRWHRTDAMAETTPIIEDGVISDARLRARRRRAGYIVASMVAVAAVAVGVFGGQFGGSDEPALSPADHSAWFAGPSSDATVVAKWSRIHVGWVYVFDDGRALVHRDGTGIRERRLTPRGSDVLRSGSLNLRRLLTPSAVELASEPLEYRPTAYALCHVVPSDPLDQLADIGAIRNRLPASVQTILRGSLAQSFTVDFEEDGLDFEHSDPGRGVDCLVLGPGQARAVFSHVQQPDGSRVDGGLTANDQTYGALPARDGAELNIVAIPILPHGGWVLWGG